jgi:ABC-type uncharacterized transport system permease subunit
MFVTCLARKNFTSGSLSDCLLIFLLRWNSVYLCISDHYSREVKTCSLRILFGSLVIIYIHSKDIHPFFASTPIVLEHYLTVIVNILFSFNLRYSNDVFSYQTSLPDKSVIPNWIVFLLLQAAMEVNR